jgi:hypothetical protein
VEEVESLKLGDALDTAIQTFGAVYDRQPVLNREPRPNPENNRELWGALMARDGGKCWMCHRSDGFMVIDHLTPRSAFRADEIRLADRSDNLAIACWDCNTEKGNRLIPFRPPLPVVVICVVDWKASFGWTEEELNLHLERYSDETMHAFCCQHRSAATVPKNWPIMALH